MKPLEISKPTFNSPPTVCKICLAKDDLSALISPCKCSGSIKYVHPSCMKSWRLALLECGREKDLYRCTLCQQKLIIKQRNPLRALLDYKVARAIGTLFILILCLIPMGSIMKMIIHFSALVTNGPEGGYSQAWMDGTFRQLLYSSIRTAFLSMLSNTTPSSHYVNFSPFPICAATSSTNHPSITSTLGSLFSYSSYVSHSLLASRTLYFLTFPFSDDRLWRFMLCQLDHIHLGFFLLGSIANIWYTCHILSDMFDIVFMGDDIEQLNNNGFNSAMGLGMMLSRQGGNIAKRLLVTYCCAIIILFWIHFTLLVFVVSESPANHYQHLQTSSQFITELPLWGLRWATVGVAVGSVMKKVIYPWLSRRTSCIDQEIVVSLPTH
ncbi:uncharacterized protein BX664DRAFT_331755 [Halteromyces radiatus]|uniref:uncharacterized protein n=1 Tax=Halteromyces radiatus TaxID=101107 RepID=UPI00221FE01E|nr:uncharacterized protein BX664DRAFT_331755 [Halteromyces radiatus]KAI8088934.1 hypothetical protein BX664DRAFT_331755 [Halteromyces radiatus]